MCLLTSQIFAQVGVPSEGSLSVLLQPDFQLFHAGVVVVVGFGVQFLGLGEVGGAEIDGPRQVLVQGELVMPAVLSARCMSSVFGVCYDPDDVKLV